MTTKCSKCINLFCFVCGQFAPKKNSARISPQILNGYNLYFGIDAKEEMSKSWAPNVTYFFHYHIRIQCIRINQKYLFSNEGQIKIFFC